MTNDANQSGSESQKTDKNELNIVWHKGTISSSSRAEQKQQKPCLLWFTGLSGAGKSTIANALEQELFRMGHHSYLLDGDNVRHGLNSDLGFTDRDRIENIRRIGEVAKLMTDAGLIVLSAFISPFKADRQMVRRLMKGQFIEVYVSTSLEVCESRDPKGLYKKARQGLIKNFTGIDSSYEAPEEAEILLDGTRPVESLARQVMQYLCDNGYIKEKA